MATADRTKITKPSPIVEDDQGQLRARQGISREVVRELSKVKGEPAWMAEKRLKSLEIFERKPVPTWGVDLSGLNLDDLVLYSPPTAGRFNSWDDVPEEMKQTYEDLGIPQAEREHLAGVVGVWRQEPVYEGLKEEYRKLGILFCSMDTAITEYPDLVQKYFMNKCVPPQDNKFSALHGAVWSGGSFLYVPKGVKVDLPLQAYFRMEGAGEGTFEHTLIIADEGSDVNYIEGCTAQTYSVNSMHSAVVEIFVHEGAKARYTTVQNWSKDVYNLNTKRAVVDAEGTVEWVGGSMGAKYVMLYPGSFLLGEGARADHLNVGVAGAGVHKDTGAKVVHLAPNTTSNILAKSISKDGGIMGYRGLVRMGHNSAGSKARVQCDGSDDGRDLSLGHLAGHPDPEPERDRGPRGDRGADLRRPALLHGLARLHRGRGGGHDRQRLHRAGDEGAADGVRRRAEPPHPARDGRLDRLIEPIAASATDRQPAVRTDFDPATLGPHAFYGLLTAVIVPRPIAWVSSISPEGVENLAPHSFFTVACVDPPVIQFTSVGRKDSLNNIEATGEFVVNVTPEPLFEQINATGTNFPPGISEFDAVGVRREPSRHVRPPRVADSPVALECLRHATLSFGNATVVFGRVVHAAIDEGVLTDGRPDVRRLRPIARLGANEWSRPGEVAKIDRIAYSDWPGHYAPSADPD